MFELNSHEITYWISQPNDLFFANRPSLRISVTANIVVFFLQMFGLLGNPFVTLVYLIEQVEIFGFGSTSRASDIRILLSFIINVPLAVFGNWLTPLLGYIASHNLLFGIGLPKPFVIVNEQLLQQKTLTDIVFKNANKPLNMP